MFKNYDHNEFENLLKSEVDKHKMFPSDRIWRNIQKEIHGDVKWPALTIMSVFIITLATFLTVIYNHSANTSFSNALVESSTPNIDPKATKEEISSKKLQQHFLGIRSIANNTNLQEEPLMVAQNTTPNLPIAEVQSIEKKIVILPVLEKKDDFYAVSNFNNLKLHITNNNKLASNSVASLQANSDEIKSTEQKLKEKLDKSKTDDYIADLGFQTQQKFKKITRKSKWSFQFYFTPSSSYRKLVDDKSRDFFEPAPSANAPIAPRYNLTVNDVVHHKPALGLELGFGYLYKLNKKLSLSLGGQFNIRKYYIDSYLGGYGIATIAVVRNNRLDTISQLTSLNANMGYLQTKLNNRLLQFSLPIGLQWNVFSYRKLSIQLASSIQPTLTLNKNVYLISTDYKYYANGTKFFRTWNVNSSAELKFSYKMGKYSWFLSPQIRYQHLPTYNVQYPIKEYRFDYGLKIGFSKELRK